MFLLFILRNCAENLTEFITGIKLSQSEISQDIMKNKVDIQEVNDQLNQLELINVMYDVDSQDVNDVTGQEN